MSLFVAIDSNCGKNKAKVEDEATRHHSVGSSNFSFFFFFIESFNLWRSLLIIALYHQTKTPINFWYKRKLNPRSLIQSSETLPVELTGTHHLILVFKCRWMVDNFYYVGSSHSS